MIARLALAAVVLACLAPILRADEGRADAALVRWAVVPTAELTREGLADLALAELGRVPGVQLVEREQIDAAARELRLAAALGPAAAARLDLGGLLRADALVLLAGRTSEEGPLVEVVISECRQGARLWTELVPRRPGDAQAVAGRLAALVTEMRGRYPQGVRALVGVADLVNRSLMHDFDFLQDQAAYVLQDGLAALPGCAVLELEEARAIRRELELAGGRLAERIVPLLVAGEYRVEAGPQRDAHSVEIILRIEDGGAAHEPVTRRCDSLAEAVAWLRSEAPAALLRLAPEPAWRPLSEQQQLAWLAARAATCARLGDLRRATGLREALLLIWPEDADQRRALLREYTVLLRADAAARPAGEPAMAHMHRLAADWRSALEHLEHLVRRQLVTRGTVLEHLRALRASQEAFAAAWNVAWRWQPPRPETDAQHTALALLAAAEADRRRFVREVAPALDNLADSEPSTFVIEPPEGIRAHARWGRFPGEVIDILYPPPGSQVERMHRGRPFPGDAADLEYTLDVLRNIARGRPDLAPFIPEQVLRREFIPLRRPEYTDAQLDAFVAALCAAPYDHDRFMGRVCTEILRFSRARPRDTRAAEHAVQAIAALEAEHLPRLDADSAGRIRAALARIRIALLRVAAGEDITRPPPGTPASPPPGPAPEPPPAFDVQPVTLRLHPRRAPDTSSPAARPWTDVLPCAGRFDVFWHADGTVACHVQPGELRETAAGGEPIQAVAWDGRHVWVGRTDKLLALDERGAVALEVGASAGLPPHDRGLALAGIEPGCVLAVGSFGPEARAWCALVRAAGGTADVHVFHEATRVPAAGDPDWLATVDPGLAFRPGRIHACTPPVRAARPLWIVERYVGNNDRPCPHHLLVDLDNSAVGVLPARHPDACGELLGLLPDGSALVGVDHGRGDYGPIRWIPPFGQRTPTGDTMQPLMLPWSGPAGRALLHDGCAYFGRGRLFRYDPATGTVADLGRHPALDPDNTTLGVSALLGLIAWDRSGQLSRITPHEPATAESPPPAPTPQPLTPAGGIVRDPAGNPLPGAQVYLLDNHPPELVKIAPYGPDDIPTLRPYDYLAITDEHGRWQASLLPGSRDRLWLRIGHPRLTQHALDYRPLGPEHVAALLAGRLDWTPPTQPVLAGRVLRPDGTPVPRAAVTLSSDAVAYRTDKLSQVTDNAGAFRFDLPPAGVAFLVVRAPGCAPEHRPVYVDAGAPPLELRVAPGRTLRVQIVDEAGQPVPGARLALYRWRGRRDLPWAATADADGRVAWDEAPADEVLYTVEKEGFELIAAVGLTADDSVHTVSLRRPRVLAVRGRVTDAATGAPVPRFAVADRHLLRIPPPNVHDMGVHGIFEGGAFQAQVTDRTRPAGAESEWDRRFRPEPRDLALWFVADGYVPQRQALPTAGAADVALDVRLHASAGLRGSVLHPDGLPVAGALVAMATPGSPLSFINRLEAPNDPVGGDTATTDPDGRFALPPPGTDYLLVALHDEHGFALAAREEFEATPTLVLQPWGRVEGVCRIGAAGGAYESLQLDLPAPEDRLAAPYLAGRWETRTDAAGRFAFERVPPLTLELRRCVQMLSSAPFGAPDWHCRPVRVEPGQTTHIAFEPLGRPVRGQIAAAAGCDLPLAAFQINGYLRPVFPDGRPAEYAQWSRAEQLAWDGRFRKSPAGLARLPVRRYYLPELTAAGQVWFADVAPGWYWLELYAVIAGSAHEPAWYLETEFEVPAATAGDARPVELGPLVLHARTDG